MKLAAEHKQIELALRACSDDIPVYTACHYFWNPGSTMEKSTLGLLQSLLYQIFKARPDPIPDLCPDKSNYEGCDIKT